MKYYDTLYRFPDRLGLLHAVLTTGAIVTLVQLTEQVLRHGPDRWQP